MVTDDVIISVVCDNTGDREMSTQTQMGRASCLDQCSHVGNISDHKIILALLYISMRSQITLCYIISPSSSHEAITSYWPLCYSDISPAEIIIIA